MNEEEIAQDVKKDTISDIEVLLGITSQNENYEEYKKVAESVADAMAERFVKHTRNLREENDQ